MRPTSGCEDVPAKTAVAGVLVGREEDSSEDISAIAIDEHQQVEE
jgi:hypothetical protein